MRNHKIYHVFILFWTVCMLCSFAQNKNFSETADQIVKNALEEQKGYKLLEELCRIGPRLCGSDGSKKSIEWALSHFQTMGLDKVYLQNVTVPHWEAGGTEVLEIFQSQKLAGKKLAVGSLGKSIGTSSEGIVAEVMEVKSIAELLQKKAKARGKFIFFNRPMEHGIVDTFTAYGHAVDQRAFGPVEAGKIDAAGAIVRSVTTRYDNAPHTGSLYYKEDTSKIPSVAIGLQDADFLSNALKEEPGLRLKMVLSCKMLAPEPSANVIAEITGSEKPEEVIVVGGHLDSWNKGEGAHDDGAGCIQALEVVYLFKKLGIKPKRTVRCVFFMNEEMGVDGAKEYGKYALSSKELHLAAIESDRGGFTPRGFSVQTANPEIIKKLEGWSVYLNKAQIEWVRPGGSGVDVSQIKNAKALIAYVPDEQRYFDFHHSENDLFSQVHPRELELGSAAIAILVYLISEEGFSS